MKIDIRKFDKLTANQWEDKIHYRGVDRKYKKLLVPLLPMYIDKVDNRLSPRLEDLQFFLNNPLTFGNLGKFLKVFSLDIFEEHSHVKLKEIAEEEVEFLNQKILRITDKYAAVTKEIELRSKKQVKRDPHGTIYYIDLDNGDDDLNDGLSKDNPWLTIEKYTTVEVRTAGDIAKVRANTSEIKENVDLACDEDGNVDNYITIKGCDSVDDPWSDGSDVRPIINFNGSGYYFRINGDHHWKLENLDIKDSHETLYGGLTFDMSSYCVVKNCRFYEATKYGLSLMGSATRIQVINCEFWDNVTAGIKLDSDSHYAIIKGCIFNGGIAGSLRGIYVPGSYAGGVRLIDCSFGQTTSHSTDDIYLTKCGLVFMRNVILDIGIGYSGASPYVERSKSELHEDYDQTFEKHKTVYYDGQVERETTIVRAGGADSSLKMTPSSDVGKYRPLTIKNEYQIVYGAFKVWLAASVEKTITIYIRGFGWTGFPTASQLFLRASYLSNAGTAARTDIDSDEVIANNDDWVGFQVTLTPAREGFVYLDVYVAHYEVSSGVYVDIKPVVS